MEVSSTVQGIFKYIRYSGREEKETQKRKRFVQDHKSDASNTHPFLSTASQVPYIQDHKLQAFFFCHKSSVLPAQQRSFAYSAAKICVAWLLFEKQQGTVAPALLEVTTVQNCSCAVCNSSRNTENIPCHLSDSSDIGRQG